MNSIVYGFPRLIRRRRRYRHGVTVTVHPYDGTEENELGNEVKAFGPDRTLDDCVVAPRPASTEPSEPARTAVIVGKTLYGPSEGGPGPHDEVTLPDGKRYAVVGEVGDWGPNPYTGSTPGFEVALQRVEG